MEGIRIQREQLDIMRDNGQNDIKLRGGALALEQNREAFTQLATLRRMGLDERQFDLVSDQVRSQLGLSEAQFNWATLMSEAELQFRSYELGGQRFDFRNWMQQRMTEMDSNGRADFGSAPPPMSAGNGQSGQNWGSAFGQIPQGGGSINPGNQLPGFWEQMTGGRPAG
jgi:hypothetical protein